MIKIKKRKVIITLISILALIISYRLILSSKNNKVEESVSYHELKKGDLVESISTSGKVLSEKEESIYTSVNAPVEEIFVKVGDRVKKGDALASLDISNLNNELEEAKLNRQINIENLNQANQEKEYSIKNNHINLENSNITLKQQELTMERLNEDLKKILDKSGSKLDLTKNEMNINETKVYYENKIKSLELLNKEEKDLKTNINKFDDSEYKKELVDKARQIERKKKEFKNLNLDIVNLKNQKSNTLYNNQNEKLNDISNQINNQKELLRKLYNEKNEIELRNNDTENEEEKMYLVNITKEITDKENLIKELEYRYKDIKTEIENDKNKYESEFKENIKSKVEDLERQASLIKLDIDELERDYNQLPSELKKKKADELKRNIKEHEKLKEAIKDLEYEVLTSENNYKKALIDKENLIKEFIEEHNNKIKDTEEKIKDQNLELNRNKNNIKDIKNNLEQSKNKQVSDTSLMINNLNIRKIEGQIKDGKIIASSDGVITKVNAEVGKVTNDVMFVIEDLENVYIKAKVKEHNLLDIKQNQKTILSTVTTENDPFEGKINYISQRAVSDDDSSNVEFEIHVKPNYLNENVKVGMNAFLKIITKEKKNIFKVPNNCIYTDNDKKYVVTERDEKIEVELGESTRQEVEIISNKLTENLKLKIKNEDEGVNYDSFK